MNKNYRKVTMIEDLPELTDLENDNYYDNKEEKIVEKYIRTPHLPYQESGMLENLNNINEFDDYNEDEDDDYKPYEEYEGYQKRNVENNEKKPFENFKQPSIISKMNDIKDEYIKKVLPSKPQNQYNSKVLRRPNMREIINGEQIEVRDIIEPLELPRKPLRNTETTELSCVDVCSHVDDCRVCSKFYKNNDMNYLIVIFILSIFCLILLKQVFDMCNKR